MYLLHRSMYLRASGNIRDDSKTIPIFWSYLEFYSFSTDSIFFDRLAHQLEDIRSFSLSESRGVNCTATTRETTFVCIWKLVYTSGNSCIQLLLLLTIPCDNFCSNRIPDGFKLFNRRFNAPWTKSCPCTSI